MHAHEVHEKTAHAQATGNKAIGLTIAVLAVRSAFVTVLMSHTSTDKVIVETKIADCWSYSHSNDSNARLYDVNAKVAELSMQTAPLSPWNFAGNAINSAKRPMMHGRWRRSWKVNRQL
jgi:hypothetical protein